MKLSWYQQRLIAVPVVSPKQRRFRSDNIQQRKVSTFEGYEEDLLDAPLHKIKSAIRNTPTPTLEELPKSVKEETIDKARIIFGSRLAGPAERRDAIKKASQNIAGILVPPKPEEPDNCCMSGCVNCVWDTYRDELEEWAEASVKARAKLQEQRVQGESSGMMSKATDSSNHVAVSMDDDGGGSEANWEGSSDLGEDGADIFAGIPIGIREFMRTEKKLKEERKRNTAEAVND